MTNPFLTLDARLRNIENLLLDIKHPRKDINSKSKATDTEDLGQPANQEKTVINKAIKPKGRASNNAY